MSKQATISPEEAADRLAILHTHGASRVGGNPVNDSNQLLETSL